MASKALNVCLAIVRWAPVVFITAVIGWSYYAYVVQMCILTIDNIPEKAIYLIIYHPIMLWFAWCYWKTIFAEVGTVPKEFFLSRSDVERFETADNEETQREILARLARNLPVQCRTSSGAIRYCEKCKCIKPDRCHHCSVCGACVLKMDHHCPWVNNCVNFTNYKFFILFLASALLYCLYVAGTSVQYFIRFWTSIGRSSSGGSVAGSLHIVFLFFASIMFSISVVSLLAYHLFLVCVNRSTLESFRAPIFRGGPDKDGFSLGRRGNFQEVFGDDKKLWLLPIYSSKGDGASYPTRLQQPTASYHSMESTTNTNSNSLQQQPPGASAATADPAFEKDSTVIAVTDASNSINPVAPVNTTTAVTASSQQPASFGDGVTFPIRSVDEDYDRLLGDRQRWMEEGDEQGAGGDSSSDNNIGYLNKGSNLHNPI